MAARKYGFYDFRQNVGMPLLTTGAADVAATTTTGVINIGGQPLNIYHAGAGAGALCTVADDAAGHQGGMSLPVPATDNIGCELTPTAVSNVNNMGCFTVGAGVAGTNDAFFMRVVAAAPNPLRADAVGACGYLFCGFRTAGANAVIAELDTLAELVEDADATPYGAVAGITLAYTAASSIYTSFKTNSAAGANTVQAGLVEVAATQFTYEVRVSGAGVVTGYRNGTILVGAAANVIGTITAATVVTPSVIYVAGATPDAAPIITSITYGYV